MVSVAMSSIGLTVCAQELCVKTVDGTTIHLTESMTSESCRRMDFSLPSASMGRDIRVVMILPPSCTDSGTEAYPFLYMLHGKDAPYDTWVNMSPIRKLLKDHPMVLVAFDGDPAGYYIDAPEKKDSQFETFFFDELSPFIEKAFWGNGQRAVTGFSMGGFGAVHYMLCRPDYFTSVSSLSGALRAKADYDQRRMDYFLPLLGPPDFHPENYAVLDMQGRLKEMLASGAVIPPMFIACGANDFLLEVNRRFRDILEDQNRKIIDQVTAEVAGITDAKEKRDTLRQKIAENQINYLYEESPGDHNFAYWNEASERVGFFHWKQFQNASQGASLSTVK